MPFVRNFNNNNSVSVNTRLYTDNGDDSSLVISAWNDKLSLRFAPCTGTNTDGVRMYEQDTTKNGIFAINQDNGVAFKEGINEVIIPAINDGVAANVAIVTEGVNSANKTNKKYLVLSVDANGVIVLTYKDTINNIMIDHKFVNGRSYIKNDEEININTSFIRFKTCIELMYNLTPDIAHTIKYIDAVKAAYSNNHNRYANDFNSQPANQNQNNFQAPINNIAGSSMGEFIPFK